MDDGNAAGSGTPPERVPARKRQRRWLSRVALALAALFVLACAGGWLIVENLEHPWVKSRLLALIEQQSGLELDYTGLELSLSRGVRARELRVLSPPRFAEHAPTLLRVRELELEVSPWALAWRREISALSAARLELNLVRDASGLTTLTDLQPLGPPLPDAEQARPSRALSNLPRLHLKQLDIGAIEARLIELRRNAPRRDVAASGLGLQGVLQSGVKGLEGSHMALVGAPLVLEVSEGAVRWRAELPSEVRLHAADARSVAVGARVEVGEQDAVPGWAAPRQLLELEGSVRFDAPAGKTTLELARLEALDGAVSSELRADVYEAEGLRVVTSGRTNIGLATLPAGPWRGALDGLELDLTLRELSWEGARVAGTIAGTGRVSRVELALPGGHARLSTAAVSAEGSFGGLEDGFRGTLTAASLDVHTPEGALGLGSLVAELNGTSREQAGAQQIDARASLQVASGTVSAPGAVDVELERVSVTAAVDELIRGVGVQSGAAGAAEMPLSVASARGTLSISEVNAGKYAARNVALALDLHQPLAWAARGEGAPRANARGRIGSLGLRGSRGTVELGADAVLDLGALRISTALRGEQGAALDLALDARFDRSRQRLRYGAELSAEKLEVLVALLSGLVPSVAPFELGSVRVRGSASGDLRGVLRSEAGLLPVLVRRPWATARGSQVLQMEIEGVDYRGPSGTLVIPELTVELGSVHGARGGGHLNGSVRARAVQLEGGGNAVRLSGLTQWLEASFERPPDEGTLEVRSALRLDSAAQSWLPAYSMRDVQASTHVDIERLRAIFLRELRLKNPVARTELRARGALELHPRGMADSDTLIGRRAVALEGRLDQDLAPLEGMGLADHARGSLAVPFRIESGGLLAYRVLAELMAHDVSWTTPERSLVIEGLSGSIPIEQELVRLPGGLAIGPKPRSSPLAGLRFFDVHPLLMDRGYVAANRITLGGSEILGPLAANVRIEHSDFLIDQLQVGFRGGQIVGRMGLEYGDNEPVVRLRLNATGVRSSGSGDVFDANLALTFVLRAMTLDGKVQIVHASRAHVLEIMDKLDPFHESVNANRVRRALTFGHPKYVRFLLHDGAVDTEVDLGGLAAAVRVDEIKAVPLGPLLERYVAPALSGVLERGARPAASDEVALEPEPDPASAGVASRRRAEQDTRELRP